MRRFIGVRRGGRVYLTDEQEAALSWFDDQIDWSNAEHKLILTALSHAYYGQRMPTRMAIRALSALYRMRLVLGEESVPPLTVLHDMVSSTLGVEGPG